MRMRYFGAILLLLLLVAQGTSLASSEVIRLHVLANSDSPVDQDVKEQVRDAIIEQLGPIFAEMEQGQVETWIVHNKEYICQVALKALQEAGADYPVQIKYGVIDYPTRQYGNSAYPAGKYRSLRIIIGEGQGRNWWCLMFPPLCFVDEVHEVDEQQEGVKVRFWLFEKIASLFGRSRGAE